MATPAEDDDAPDHDCYDADVMPPLGSADSESFSSDSEATASNSVGVYGAEEDAAAALAIIRDPDVQDCLRDMITGQIKKGALTDGVKVRDLSFGALSVPAFGDDRAALRLEVTVESGPFTPTLYLDVVFVQVGRALAIYEFADVLWPFDEELGTDLVETTVERLRASVS